MSWTNEMRDIYKARNDITKGLKRLFEAYEAQGLEGGSSHDLAVCSLIEGTLDRYDLSRKFNNSLDRWEYFRR